MNSDLSHLSKLLATVAFELEAARTFVAGSAGEACDQDGALESAYANLREVIRYTQAAQGEIADLRSRSNLRRARAATGRRAREAAARAQSLPGAPPLLDRRGAPAKVKLTWVERPGHVCTVNQAAALAGVTPATVYGAVQYDRPVRPGFTFVRLDAEDAADARDPAPCEETAEQIEALLNEKETREERRRPSASNAAGLEPRGVARQADRAPAATRSPSTPPPELCDRAGGGSHGSVGDRPASPPPAPLDFGEARPRHRGDLGPINPYVIGSSTRRNVG